MKEIRDKETLWHDTQLLLRKYRQVKWALEVSSQQALKELQQRTGGTLDTFLHAAVFAGADKFTVCGFLFVLGIVDPFAETLQDGLSFLMVHGDDSCCGDGSLLSVSNLPDKCKIRAVRLELP